MFALALVGLNTSKRRACFGRSVATAASQAPLCRRHHPAPAPHGLQVRATVGQPRVELVTPRVNFGLVRLKGKAKQPLLLRNTSKTCRWVGARGHLSQASLLLGSGMGCTANGAEQ